MNTKPEYRIGIIGCGKMGKDLFGFLTGFPFHITFVCKAGEAVDQIANSFEKKQKRALKYQLIDQDTIDFHNKNTVITSALELLANCNFVVETITEDINRKRELFEQLEPILSPDCVLASNTSSITPDELFAGLPNEEKCLGLHFFFPVAVKDIVEINVAKNTNEKTVSLVKDFLKKLGKFHVVLAKKDHFIINRIFMKMQAGCCQLLQEKIMGIEELDVLVKARLFPVGVFEFFDQVGNDVMLHSVKNYMRCENDPGFYQPLIDELDQNVKEGKLGIKSNYGFYEYPLKTALKNIKEIPGMINAMQKITHWYLDGVFDAYKNSTCTKDELEHIVKVYMMVEKSPFDLAVENGYTPK